MKNNKYVIMDEYQDIVRHRLQMAKCLAYHAKIIAAGNDWQSFYAFSGSDIIYAIHPTDGMLQNDGSWNWVVREPLKSNKNSHFVSSHYRLDF